MWFRNNLARLYKERRAINDLNAEADWLIIDWRLHNAVVLYLIVNIQVYDRCYPLVMIYPTNYPANPPIVIPRTLNQSLSTHQYGKGGELCLEWGPDNWHQELTGADLLRSAYKLLVTENPTEDGVSQIVAPSRHLLALGQQLQSSVWRFVVNDDLITYTQSLPKHTCGIAEFWIMCHRETVTAFARRLTLVNGKIWDNATLPIKLESVTAQIECRFFKVNLEVNALNFSNLSSLIDAFKIQNPDVARRMSVPTCLVLFSTREGLRLFSASDPKKWVRFANININHEKYNSRLGPEFTKLKTKKVGIVGVGSAGSKIAISLARTGVRDFLLVDHDVFLPENICRHELNWEEVGQHKVDGIAHQLKLITQKVNVTCCPSKLSGQESTANIDSILSQLGACDLIIDATADPLTFNQLSTVAYQQQTPMVWLEILEGGIGGFIARFRPNRDPDPKTMRGHLNRYLEEKYDTSEMRGTTDYTAVDSEGRIITASDADVTIIAANATKLALDILVEREPSEFPYSLYLIGLTGKQIFDQPLHTIPIDLKNAKLTITERELSEDEATENHNFVKQLISKEKNENSLTE